jgi:hypothetical protein
MGSLDDVLERCPVREEVEALETMPIWVRCRAIDRSESSTSLPFFSRVARETMLSALPRSCSTASG